MAHEKWLVKDRKRLLVALAQVLTGGDARLSLEGDLHKYPLMQIAGASDQETNALRRNTLSPKQDFVVLPLSDSALRLAMSVMGGNIPRSILHVQIARDGRLEFGAYDQFSPECIVFGPGVPRDVIDLLVTQNVLICL